MRKPPQQIPEPLSIVLTFTSDSDLQPVSGSQSSKSASCVGSRRRNAADLGSGEKGYERGYWWHECDPSYCYLWKFL